ncbi:amidase family protein [Altererythrobacter sp. C41]|uniref:amidase family protein n=1 Tax=Altererythrobacter sp. C41 TaxID=2806021 RepID=UPI0019320228|nr:amidase family protein [Altererythrobacter sp. C41]MBM0170437.1 amidase [Altererythrobacter sp. C41]
MIPTLTDQPGAIALAAQIRSGALSPLEAVDAAIARIEDRDMQIDAVVVCDFERARETAAALDGQTPGEDRPLFGVPMTIKESFDIAGLPTTWGHEQFAGNIARRDARIVQKLKAAGVIFIGKTNVPPDLADWQSRNPVYGRTRNPHDTSRSPGGSSGGSAAAVASGMVPCEYGTDIGGSVRVPAHFCGVWGHKTSWGLISKHGHDHPMMAGSDAHDGALSIAGPLARNADDLALLLQLTASIPMHASGRRLADCRLLLVTDYPGSPVDAAVLGPIEAAVAALEDAGVRVERTTDLLPDLARQQQDYMKMLNVAMARGMPAPDGKRATATDWFDLLDAQARTEAAWHALFETYDFVLAPPAPVLAMPHREGRVFDGTLTINGREESAAAGLAWAGIATFPNLPSTVLPVGATDGLPCGMQVIGPRWADLDCIAAAKAIGEILHG